MSNHGMADPADIMAAHRPPPSQMWDWGPPLSVNTVGGGASADMYDGAFESFTSGLQAYIAARDKYGGDGTLPYGDRGADPAVFVAGVDFDTDDLADLEGAGTETPPPSGTETPPPSGTERAENKDTPPSPPKTLNLRMMIVAVPAE